VFAQTCSAGLLITETTGEPHPAFWYLRIRTTPMKTPVIIQHQPKSLHHAKCSLSIIARYIRGAKCGNSKMISGRTRNRCLQLHSKECKYTLESCPHTYSHPENSRIPGQSRRVPWDFKARWVGLKSDGHSDTLCFGGHKGPSHIHYLRLVLCSQRYATASERAQGKVWCRIGYFIYYCQYRYG
jgi:hypothetical protein